MADTTDATAGFRVLDETLVHRGPVVELAMRRVRTPEGAVVEREVVRHPGAVGLVPVLPDGRVVLVRQYRAPVDRELLEIPAGKRDVPGEAPERTALRELAEEVGCAAGELTELGRWYQSPGFCDEEMVLYLAQQLTEVPREAHGVEEEHLHIETVALDDVLPLVATGELCDAKTIVGLLLARDHLEGRTTVLP